MRVIGGFVDLAIGGFDGQAAAAFHRVAGIEGEIEEGGLKLVRIDKDRPHPVGQPGRGRDLVAQRVPRQVRHAGNDIVDVDRLRVDRFAADKAEQPLRQIRCSLATAQRRGDEPLTPRIVGVQIGFQQGDVARHDHQQIVEIVRDARSQQPHGLHLLRLVQLGLDRGAFGDRITRRGEGQLLPAGATKPEQAQQHQSDGRGNADRGIAGHILEPFAYDRGARPLDRDVNRIVREPLIGDEAALATERPAAGDDPGGRLAGNRRRHQLILLPRRGRVVDFGIARKAFAVFEQHAGGILRRTAEQRMIRRRR